LALQRNSVIVWIQLIDRYEIINTGNGKRFGAVLKKDNEQLF